MANRVDAADVKAIIDTDLSDSDVGVFITTANNIVTARLSEAGLSDETLVEIERWLSAHLVAIRSPLLKKQEIMDAVDEYQYGKLGMGLQFTAYGQQVLLLDTSGILSTMGGKGVYFKGYGADTGGVST